MRYIFYHYNSEGALIFNYRDENGGHIKHFYLCYPFREALQNFRKDYGLQRKHIEIHRAY